MLSGISLVAILLALNCASRATDHPSAATNLQEAERVLTSGRKVLRHAFDSVASDVSVVLDVARDKAEDKLALDEVDDEVHGAQSKIGVEERDRPRNRKRRMDRTMLALLMAYKLKMIALIPTMIGGLILLKGTTLLAGFFFALFAAVLGLRIH